MRMRKRSTRKNSFSSLKKKDRSKYFSDRRKKKKLEDPNFDKNRTANKIEKQQAANILLSMKRDYHE